MAAKPKKKVGFSHASRFIIWAWIMLMATILFFGLGMGTNYWVRTNEGDLETNRGLWKFCRHENIDIFPYRYELRCYMLDVSGKKPWQEKVRVIQGLEATAMALICLTVAFAIPLYILILRLNSKAMAGILMGLCGICAVLIIIGVALFWVDFVDQGIGEMGYSIPLTLVGAGFCAISTALLAAEFVKFKD